MSYFLFRMNPKKNLYVKIGLYFFLIGLLPLLAVSFSFNRLMREHISVMVRQYASNLTEELIVILKDKILVAYKNTQLLADSPIVRADDVPIEEKIQEMQKIFNVSDLFNDINLINLEGVTLISLRDNFKGDWKYKKWFKAAVSGGTDISPVLMTINPKGFAIFITVPVLDNNGAVKAVLASRLDIEKIWKITDEIKIGNTGFVFITDSRGKLYSFPDKNKILYQITPEYLRQDLITNQSGTIEFTDEGNIPKFCFYKTISAESWHLGLDWKVGIIQNRREVYAVIYKMFTQITLIAIICVLAIIILALVLTNKITKPISILARASGKVAGGNLEIRVPVPSNDEIGQVSEAFNIIINSMHDIVLLIRTNAEKVASSSQELSSSIEEMNFSTQEISSAVQQVSKGAITQSERIGEAFDLTEKASVALRQMVTNAKSTSVAVNQTSTRADDGRTLADETVVKIERLTTTIMDTVRVIRGLGDKSQQIGEITETITSIADQTNLLALNAAIEAARAGEAGRGFAVVAEEVRKLAEGSAEAVRNISVLIKSIQIETSNAVNAIESSSKEMQEGKIQVAKIVELLIDLNKVADKATVLTYEIEQSGQRQVLDTERVVKAVNEVAFIAKESVSTIEHVSSSIQEQIASMEEMSVSAQVVAHLAMELRDIVGKFKLKSKSVV